MAEDVLICSEDYWNFDFGRFHPLRPIRVKLTFELMKDLGLLEGSEVVKPREATEEELLTYHEKSYLEALKREEPNEAFGLGTEDNSVVSGIFRYASLSVGGTLIAAEAAYKGGVAFNLGGGMHHAKSGKASGFCYLNDVVIAIKHLLSRGARVFYLDIDAHHCDAVQEAFYEEDRILVLSIHQEGIFPGTGDIEEMGEGRGKGYNINVPIPRYSEDEDVLWIFEKLVIPVLERFSPDVLFVQVGADAHKDDPLTSLYLTTGIYAKAAELLRQIKSEGILITGGGGYDIVNVARIWSIFWGKIRGVSFPEELPERFLRIAIMEGYVEPTIWDIPGWSGLRQHVKQEIKERVDYLTRHLPFF